MGKSAYSLALYLVIHKALLQERDCPCEPAHPFLAPLGQLVGLRKEAAGVERGAIDDLPVDGVLGQDVTGEWVGVPLEYRVGNLERVHCSAWGGEEQNSRNSPGHMRTGDGARC